MPEEIIINVTENVIYIAIALLGAYAAMYVIEEISHFAGTMFSGIKLFGRFNFKKGDAKSWDI